ncbi:hypothetical protein [Chondromyces apiculatus]|uniref:Lipoprotein n=1 Tax=Chondromyces apiculatus DSM 436 TaxID=1192034 RepID=A0A017SYH0_9BACT|nr:hypothetical protein [Chondromyces apiculatus]EYF02019.1 Hypothetical protein CAP_7498 [Chondromyces apiculatus DSM 436]
MREQVSKAALLLIGAGLLALGTGCGKSKISECNALIEVINKGVQSLEKGQKAGADPTGAADLKAMAEAMDKVAADAALVELTLPELQKFSGEYQAMAKEVSRAARDMATAAEAKDSDKINVAQAAMEKAVKQEDPLVDGINKFCQAP